MRLLGSTTLLSLVMMAGVAVAADVATPGGSPGEVVNVTMTDTMTGMDMTENMGLGIGMKGDMSKAMGKMEADKFAVKAGLVTFKVTNAAKDIEHEMVVVPIANMSTPLPYIDKENRVDEDAAHDLGEVSELAPGKSGELTIELKPGLYALICNIPGHYGAGMWRVLAVQ